MGPIRKLAGEVQKQRARAQAERARRDGMTDEVRDMVFAGVIAYFVLVASEQPQEPTRQYAESWANGWLQSRLPTLDPATILVLVQLLWLVYQALKAIGFFESRGLNAVSPQTINEHLGGL